MKIELHDSILKQVPNFKVGFIFYKDIVIDESPQMLKGRLDFFQEKIAADLHEQTVLDYKGVLEWRDTFKKLDIDPTRYRPSHEALFRRVAKGKRLPFLNSAVDLNNFFSLQYEIPIGLYNKDVLQDYIKIFIGTKNERLEGLNHRINNMEGKIVSVDSIDPFGSPIVDSHRSKVETTTRNAVQIFYLQPSLPLNKSEQLLQSAAKMFTQLHSGESSIFLLHQESSEIDVC